MVNLDELRSRYDKLDDQELQRIARTELIPEARTLLEDEMRSRGLALDSRKVASNPYASPKTAVADPHAWATVSVSGLVRLFQIMAVTAAVIGIILFGWTYLPIPIAESIAAYRQEAAAGGVWPELTYIVFMIAQPLWILSAFGLCFFKWWARPLFAGTYVLTMTATLFGGFVIWLPWESVLVTAATLLDGAVLALAFLPPLSTYFERDRASA